MAKQNELATENTGINTLGIMRKMGNTWRGVETSIKTGETDQGVTTIWNGVPFQTTQPFLHEVR